MKYSLKTILQPLLGGVIILSIFFGILSTLIGIIILIIAALSFLEDIKEVKEDNGGFFDKIAVFFDVAKIDLMGIGFALILVGIFLFLGLIRI